MAVLTNTVLIDRPQVDVFDYLVDLRHELEWNPGVQSMELLTGEPIGVGTRYLAKWKQSKHIEVECTHFDRPRQWTYINGGPVAVTLTITLTPEAGGTRLTSSFDAHPNNLLMRLVFPLFLRSMRRQERSNMANLKAQLESASPSTN